MYLLKKLTGFGKSATAEEAEPPAAGSEGADTSGSGTSADAPDWPGDAPIGKEDSSGSSSTCSNPSIPDCFFDDLSETSGSASEDGAGVAEEKRPPAPDGSPSSSSAGSDDSPESRPTADEVPSDEDNGGGEDARERADVGRFVVELPPVGEGEVPDVAALGVDPPGGQLEIRLPTGRPEGTEDLEMCDEEVVRIVQGRDNRQSISDCVEDYLDKESDEAEARLAARRQARVEAREIRQRELERQQKEQEENADRAFDASYAGDPVLRTGRVTPSTAALTPRDRAMVAANSYHSSRRSSEDSIEEGLSIRDIRHELKEAEEKFKKAMIANAQLDNEKSALAYQVELLKDRFEDLEETHTQLTREHRDKCREHEQLKRAAVKLKEDLEFYKENMMERDRLIAEFGLVIVDANEDGGDAPKRTLVSAQSAELLQQAGSGSLDVRLKKFAEERNELLDEIRHLKLELEEERSKRIADSRSGSLTNGPLDEETSKILSDYKFKLQKAEQDVSTLQANVARLESQVIRYKTAAESSEKAEDELKIEKRKLQRENRESIARIEELETANSHLQRRMDKLKNAKSTLLKEL